MGNLTLRICCWALLMQIVFSSGYVIKTFRTENYEKTKVYELILKLTVTTNEVTFEIDTDTTGAIGIGFGHNRSHTEETVYDTMVAGFAGGDPYVGSYKMVGHKLYPYPETRYKTTSSGNSEANGRSKLRITREVTTCFIESFDWRDVGDAALIKLLFFADDISPGTEELNLKLENVLMGEGEDFMTLFSHSQSREEVDDLVSSSLGLQEFSVQFNEVEPDGSQVLCKAAKTDDSFSFYKGFKPILSPSADHIRLMMLFQCDNTDLEDRNEVPLTGISDVSTDGCRQGADVGVEDLYKRCQDVLFVWGPGSEGEFLPDDHAIQANKADSNGNRYLMLLVSYRDSITWDVDRDSSGFAVITSDSTSLIPVAKLMVGHYISSKMIIMPTKEWIVEGACPYSCLGIRDLTEENQIHVISGAVYHGNASRTSMGITQPTSDGENYEYKSLIKDRPASPSFQINRALGSEMVLEFGGSDIVVQCGYQKMADAYVVGGAGSEYCFGVVTYYPPVPLSTCMSVPLEYTLDSAFKLNLQDTLDDFSSKKRRRRKRQSSELLQDFDLRNVISDVSGHVVADSLDALLSESSQAQLEVINGKVRSGDQFPICVLGDGSGMELLDPFKIIEPEENPEIASNAECLALNNVASERTYSPKDTGDDTKDGDKNGTPRAVGGLCAIASTLLISLFL